MEKKAIIWALVGLAVTALGGTLLHFLFDWTGGSLWAAPFSGVNESTWEHMKLFFWPTALLAAVQSFFFGRRDFLCVKLKTVLTGLILIPLLYHTYNSIIAKSPDWLNIGIFFISAAFAYWQEIGCFTKEEAPCTGRTPALVLLLALAAAFVLFTFFPPRILLFRDPVTGGYGI